MVFSKSAHNIGSIVVFKANIDKTLIKKNYLNKVKTLICIELITATIYYVSFL